MVYSEAKEKDIPAGPVDTGEEINADATYLDDLLPVPDGHHRSPKKTPNALNFLPPPPPVAPPKKFVAKDQYHLPTLASASLIDRALPTDSRIATEDDLKLFIQEMKPEDFDIDSKVFNELPVEVRYEIIGDLRLLSRQGNNHRRRRGTRYTDQSIELGQDPKTAEERERARNLDDLDFSKNQIRNLMQRNVLTQKLFEVTDQLGQGKQEPGSSSAPSTSNSHSSRLVNLSTAAAAKAAAGGGGGSRATRIAGEKNREYILVKQGKELGGGWILGSQNPVLGSNKTVVLGGSSEDESMDSQEEDFEEVVVKGAESKYGFVARFFCLRVVQLTEVLSGGRSQRLLSPPTAIPTRRNQAISALRARYASQPTERILDPYLDAPSSHSASRAIRTTSAGIVESDLFGEAEIDEEMRHADRDGEDEEEEMIQRALLEDARMGNLAFAETTFEEVGERDLGVDGSGVREEAAIPNQVTIEEDELEYIDDEDFYGPASPPPSALPTTADDDNAEEEEMTMSTLAERDLPRIQGVPYSEINPFKPAPAIPFVPAPPETIDTHAGFILSSPRKIKPRDEEEEEEEDSDEFEEVHISDRPIKATTPLKNPTSAPPPLRQSPAPFVQQARTAPPPANQDPPPRSISTKNKQLIEETTSHASFMDRILPPESDEDESDVEFEPVGVPIRSLPPKVALKEVQEIVVVESDDEEMEEVVVQPKVGETELDEIVFPLPNPFAPVASTTGGIVGGQAPTMDVKEDEEDLYDAPLAKAPSPPANLSLSSPSPPLPTRPTPPLRILTPLAQLARPSPVKSQQVSLHEFGSTSFLPRSHHPAAVSDDEALESEEEEIEVEVVEQVDLKGKGRAISPEAVLLPPRKSNEQDEESDEDSVDWEKSPTPPARQKPASLDQAAEIAEALALLEAAEEAEELENERNFQREEDQYADMLSNLRNRKLDEMRNEAANDITKLREQVNSEKRGADGVTRQMATDIKVRLSFFVSERRLMRWM